MKRWGETRGKKGCLVLGKGGINCKEKRAGWGEEVRLGVGGFKTSWGVPGSKLLGCCQKAKPTEKMSKLQERGWEPKRSKLQREGGCLIELGKRTRVHKKGGKGKSRD